MTESKGQSRRILLASALGTGASLAVMSGSKAHAETQYDPRLFASWVHGTAAHIGKVPPNFASDHHDDVHVGADVAGGILRGGFGAQMYIRGEGPDWRTNVRSGSFWVHYAIPTPVIEAGQRTRIQTLILRWKSEDFSKITFDMIQVWDGNNKLKEAPGVRGPQDSPELRIAVGNQEVLWGIGVSLRVKGAQTTFDSTLEVHSVGVDFFRPPA
jgi:hypothetical protein